MCPAGHARLQEQEQVPARLRVELQDPHDPQPLVQGLLVRAALQDPPFRRQAPVDLLQVLPLPILEGRILQVLEPAQAREGLLMRDLLRICSSSIQS